MKYLLMTICLFTVATCFSPVQAQRRKAAQKETKLTSEELIQQYRFSEAAEQLQRELNAAQKAGNSTERIEADIRRANLGSDMLRGTERITFIDSFKVSRNKVLQTIHLSKGAGRLVPMQGEKDKLRTQPAVTGSVAYINELRDRLFFSAAPQEGAPQSIQQAYHYGKGWGAPEELDGMTNGNDQGFPFMMPDGITLYYAEQGSESLGGYDLFVTRYNTGTKQFLKAENLGMPFNSPANDYLLAIDENARLGWLVTDRFQQPDSACVYVFIPNDTRDIYVNDGENGEQIIRAAKLLSIAETQTDAQAVAAARQRLASVSRQETESKTGHHFYVINDQTVYTSLSQFRSNQARRHAAESDAVKKELEQVTEGIDNLQRLVAEGKKDPALKQNLKKLYEQQQSLYLQYKEVTKRMRQAESMK